MANRADNRDLNQIFLDSEYLRQDKIIEDQMLRVRKRMDDNPARPKGHYGLSRHYKQEFPGLPEQIPAFNPFNPGWVPGEVELEDRKNAQEDRWGEINPWRGGGFKNLLPQRYKTRYSPNPIVDDFNYAPRYLDR